MFNCPTSQNVQISKFVEKFSICLIVQLPKMFSFQKSHYIVCSKKFSFYLKTPIIFNVEDNGGAAIPVEILLSLC